MLTDLQKYDVLDLLSTKHWSDDDHAAFLKEFNEGLTDYLADRLAPFLEDLTDEEIAQLKQDSHTTSEKVIAFYTLKIPGLANKLECHLLEFKRLAIIS